MSCNNVLKHAKHAVKEHDTLSLTCVYRDANGERVDITNIDIKSEIRSNTGTLIDNMSVTHTDAIRGEFILAPTLSTLPIGTHVIDVLFTDGAQRVSSDSFDLTVVKAVTAP